MKKNVKQDAKKKDIEIEKIEEIEEFDDEEFDFIEDDEEIITDSNDNTISDEDLEPLTLEERVISIEKKLNITLVFVSIASLLSLLTFIVGITSNTNSISEGTQNEQTEEEHTTSTSYDTSAFTKISAHDLKKKSKGKKIIVWIGRQGCGYCSNYVPTITNVGNKLNETIYYMDLADIFDFSTEQVSLLDEKAYDIMMKFETDKDNEGVMDDFGATPMTLIIKNNKIIGSFTGALEEETVLSTLEKEGFKQSK